MRTTRRSAILLALAVAIVAAPLVPPNGGGAFKGTDDQASQAVAQSNPDYRPWVSPLWQPPSSEIESLLFAVQAALGAGIFGYVIGRIHGARMKTDADA